MNSLKKVLKEKRIKQNWLAERLGKSENTLTNWVQGKTNISLKDLYKISEILDCPVSQLLEK
jgi:putative transcriptional regulator